MKTTRIKIQDYPITMKFDVEEKLPSNPDYGCKVRTNILWEFLRQNPSLLDNVPHTAEDFVVEEVEKIRDTEYWTVGS